MLSNSHIYVFLNAFLICGQFQELEGNKGGDTRLKKKLLNKLGFRIECKTFTFNGKLGSVLLSKFV